MPITPKTAQYAATRLKHAEDLAKDGIYLVCYECWKDGRVEPMSVPDEPVIFFPSQQETFKTMVRRVGAVATDALRNKLRDPRKCRLLCEYHDKRAKAGWTVRREELYRLDPQVGDTSGAYTIVAPNGQTVTIDEYGLGPYAWDSLREQRRKWREEWFDRTDGAPPDYDYWNTGS